MSQFKTLMPIRTKGASPPLFCVHGEPLMIAQRIRADRPIYGLSHVYYSDFVSESHESIESLAAEYLDDVRKVSPDGPYHFCGFSAGGLVAYEMARQVQASGQEVAYLALIEPTPETAGSRMDWVKESVAESGLSARVMLDLTTRLFRSAWARSKLAMRKLRVSLYFLSGRTLPMNLRWIGYLKSLGPAISKYRYAPLPCRSDIIYREMDEESFNSTLDYWRTLMGDEVTVHSFDEVQTHNQFMEDRHLQRVTALLDAALDPRPAGDSNDKNQP